MFFSQLLTTNMLVWPLASATPLIDRFLRQTSAVLTNHCARTRMPSSASKQSAISTSRWTMTPTATWTLWRQTAWVLAIGVASRGGVWPPTGHTHTHKYLNIYLVLMWLRLEQHHCSRLPFLRHTWRTSSPRLWGKCRLVSIYYICSGFQWMKRKLLTVKETLNSSGSSCYLTEIPLWLAKVCPPGFTHIKQDPLVFQCMCLQENSSPAVHSISLPCSESLPHKSVKKGKSIMTYYCLPPMLHELALVGGENVFFPKPGDWENLHYSGQPTAMRDSIGRQSTSAVEMVLAGFESFSFFPSNKMSCIFSTVDEISGRGTGCLNAILQCLMHLWIFRFEKVKY